MSQKSLAPVLISSLLLISACSAPDEPQDRPAPVLETDTSLTAREGSEFTHRVVVKSEAPPVSLALEDAPEGLTLSRDEQDGLLTWTPDFDQAGEHVVTLVAADAQTPPLTARVEITIVVEDVNQAPTVPAFATEATFPVAPGATFTVEASATDPDGDAIELTWTVSEASWGLDADGALVTVTAPSERGAQAVLTATVTDGEQTVSATLDLSTAPNQPPAQPELTTEATFPVPGGAVVTFTATTEDADDDPLTFTWSVSDDGWEVVGDGASATVKALEKDASAVLTVTVSDGEASASATYALSSLPNQAPAAPQLSTEASMPVQSGTITAFTATSVDPEGDALTWTWTVSNADDWTLASDGATATVTTLVRGVSAVLTVTVSDGDLTASSTYDISSKANAEPVVSLDAPETVVVTDTIELTALGTDADGDELSYDWIVEGAGWSHSIDGATLSLTAPADQGFEAMVTVTVTDGWGGSATTTHTLTSRRIALSGTIDFLQAGEFTIDVDGAEAIIIKSNGRFDLMNAFAPGDSWAISSQPAGQHCSVGGLTEAEVGNEDVDLAITCTVIRQTTRKLTTALTNSTFGYGDVPGLASISIELSKAANVLVALSIPNARADAEKNKMHEMYFRLDINDQGVDTVRVVNNMDGVGHPVGILTTVPLEAGSHEIKVKWSVPMGTASILNAGEIVLSAAVIESLPNGLGGLRRKANLYGTVRGDAQMVQALGHLEVNQPSQALISAHVGSARTDGSLQFDIVDSENALASGGFRGGYSMSYVPLHTLQSVTSSQSYSVEWHAPEGEGMFEGFPASFSAALFAPGTQVLTGKTSDIDTQVSTWSRVGSSVRTLELTEPKTVLVTLTASGVGMQTSTGAGEVAIRLGNDLVSTARLMTTANQSRPLVMSRVLELPAGTHTLDVAARTLGGVAHLRSWEGEPVFTAIVLD